MHHATQAPAPQIPRPSDASQPSRDDRQGGQNGPARLAAGVGHEHATQQPLSLMGLNEAEESKLWGPRRGQAGVSQQRHEDSEAAAAADTPVKTAPRNLASEDGVTGVSSPFEPEKPKRVSSFIGLPPIRTGSVFVLDPALKTPRVANEHAENYEVPPMAAHRHGNSKVSLADVSKPLPPPKLSLAEDKKPLFLQSAGSGGHWDGTIPQDHTMLYSRSATPIQDGRLESERMTSPLPQPAESSPQPLNPSHRLDTGATWKLEESHLSEPLHPVSRNRSATDLSQRGALLDFDKESGLSGSQQESQPPNVSSQAGQDSAGLRNDARPEGGATDPVQMGHRRAYSRENFVIARTETSEYSLPGVGPPPRAETESSHGHRKRASFLFQSLGNRLQTGSSRSPPGSSMAGRNLSADSRDETSESSFDMEEASGKKRPISFMNTARNRLSFDQLRLTFRDRGLPPQSETAAGGARESPMEQNRSVFGNAFGGTPSRHLRRFVSGAQGISLSRARSDQSGAVSETAGPSASPAKQKLAEFGHRMSGMTDRFHRRGNDADETFRESQRKASSDEAAALPLQRLIASPAPVSKAGENRAARRASQPLGQSPLRQEMPMTQDDAASAPVAATHARHASEPVLASNAGEGRSLEDDRAKSPATTVKAIRGSDGDEDEANIHPAMRGAAGFAKVHPRLNRPGDGESVESSHHSPALDIQRHEVPQMKFPPMGMHQPQCEGAGFLNETAEHAQRPSPDGKQSPEVARAQAQLLTDQEAGLWRQQTWPTAAAAADESPRQPDTVGARWKGLKGRVSDQLAQVAPQKRSFGKVQQQAKNEGAEGRKKRSEKVVLAVAGAGAAAGRLRGAFRRGSQPSERRPPPPLKEDHQGDAGQAVRHGAPAASPEQQAQQWRRPTQSGQVAKQWRPSWSQLSQNSGNAPWMSYQHQRVSSESNKSGTACTMPRSPSPLDRPQASQSDQNGAGAMRQQHHRQQSPKTGGARGSPERRETTAIHDQADRDEGASASSWANHGGQLEPEKGRGAEEDDASATPIGAGAVTGSQEHAGRNFRHASTQLNDSESDSARVSGKAGRGEQQGKEEASNGVGSMVGRGTMAELEDTEEARKRALRVASQEEKIYYDDDEADRQPQMTATSYPGQEWNPFGVPEYAQEMDD